MKDEGGKKEIAGMYRIDRMKTKSIHA